MRTGYNTLLEFSLCPVHGHGRILDRPSCRKASGTELARCVYDSPINIRLFFDIAHIAPAGTIDHTFIYRKQFASRPTNDTEHTWEVMFPSMSVTWLHPNPMLTRYAGGRGFVQHPTVSPTVMGMAVFHQLHCLVRRDGRRPRSAHMRDGRRTN